MSAKTPLQQLPRAVEDDEALRITTADQATVVWIDAMELPAIEIRNTVFPDVPLQIWFTGTQPKREIDSLITALEALRAVIA